jgi:hypothetical protein
MDYKYPNNAFNLQMGGFEEFSEIFKDREFRRVFDKYIKMENKQLMNLGAAHLARVINSGEFAPNSPFTQFMKKSEMPLVDHGDLRGSVMGSIGSGSLFFDVGVTRRTKSGSNLAHMLETGFTIKVTEKMRKFFFAMSRESGGEIKGLRASTQAIKVPPRPYMKSAFFTTKTFQYVVRNQWKLAVHRTFMHFANRVNTAAKNAH